MSETNKAVVIQRAVRWWQKALRAPVLSNGDGLTSAFGMMAQASKQNPWTDETLEKFGVELARRIEEAPDFEWVTLDVDYNPNKILSEAARAAGVTDDRLFWPWKTVMWLRDGKVRVRAGYGAPLHEVDDAGNIGPEVSWR